VVKVRPHLEQIEQSSEVDVLLAQLRDFIFMSIPDKSKGKTRASQINGWNRLAIAFRTPAGSYQPAARAAAIRRPRSVLERRARN